jgi:hypothetical protein
VPVVSPPVELVPAVVIPLVLDPLVVVAAAVVPDDEVPVLEVVVSPEELLHAEARAPSERMKTMVDREMVIEVVITGAWNEFCFLVIPERGMADGLSNRPLAKSDRTE